MTDSATDDTPRDGGLEAGPGLDELFGPIADDPIDERPPDREPVPRTSADERDDETATAVFDRLKADETADADAVLADDRPSEIIASADEPEPSTDESAIDAALLVDEDALEALLIPDRTEGEEFLWVDTGDASVEPAADASLTEDGATGEKSGSTGGTREEPAAGDESTIRDALDRTGTETETSYGGDERAAPAITAEGDDAASSESDSVESTSLDPGPLDLASVESEAASNETSLVVPAESELATTDDPDEDGSTGVLGWLRSKLGLS
ncbi:hypothetical protein [Natronococcus wangiae]|uniref:hypothetical protein n=1 Tax=Natronococcus wangiae TaxID=3068275 RepID=UPI00273D3ECF|nr:hypothetical protein [Natronococcus sp. AD5]